MTTVYLDRSATFDGDMSLQSGAQKNWLVSIFATSSGYTLKSQTADQVTLSVNASGYPGYAVVLKPVTVFSPSTNGLDPFYGAVLSVELHAADGSLVSTVEDFPANTYLYQLGNYGTIAAAGSQIIGSDGADIVWAFNAYGGYSIDGGAGDDTLYGGREVGYDSYADILVGGLGDDKIYGLGGDDDIVGGAGADTIDAGAGTDFVYLIEPTHHIDIYLNVAAPTGAVRVDNAEIVLLSDYGAHVQGGAGVDAVVGGLGADEIHGGDGDDLFAGLDGDDKLYGDAGDDFFDGGEGDDLLDGGAGIDGVDLSAAFGGVTIDLGVVGGQNTGQGLDTFVSIEVLYGTPYDDQITGDGGANELNGDLGDDVLSGDDGQDVLNGGLGADRLTGGGGRDVFEGTLAELSGDIIFDFRAGDAIDIIDLNPANLSYRRTSEGVVFANGVTITLGGPMNGLVVTSDGAGGSLLVPETRAVSLGDFDGDGRTDLVWRGGSGTLTTWGVDLGDAAPLQPNIFITELDKGWSLVATSDFTGDGKSDLMFRTGAGLIDIWAGFGNIFAPHQAIIPGVTRDWQIASVGDFNGDGKTDLIWRHDSGFMTEWQGSGTGGIGFTQNAYIQAGVDNNWRIAGEGDFNGDGKDDLIWRSAEGYVSEWLSTGSGFTPNVYLDFGVDKTWHLLATADFDGDGKNDLLWRNDSGVFTEWQSNGQGFDRNVYVNGGVDMSWKLESTGDFNGDGKEDLLWRHDASGVFSIWTSTGDGFISNVLVNGSVSSDWQIATNGFDLI